MRFLGILFVISVYSCNNAPSKSNDSTVPLEGKWLMEAATRDGKLTETLKDSYFIFESPNILINNINRREQSFEYKLAGNNKIEQRGSLDLDYTILKHNSDTLVLKTEIRDYDFQFLLVRDTISFEDIPLNEVSTGEEET